MHFLIYLNWKWQLQNLKIIKKFQFFNFLFLTYQLLAKKTYFMFFQKLPSDEIYGNLIYWLKSFHTIFSKFHRVHLYLELFIAVLLYSFLILLNEQYFNSSPLISFTTIQLNLELLNI